MYFFLARAKARAKKSTFTIEEYIRRGVNILGKFSTRSANARTSRKLTEDIYERGEYTYEEYLSVLLGIVITHFIVSITFWNAKKITLQFYILFFFQNKIRYHIYGKNKNIHSSTLVITWFFFHLFFLFSYRKHIINIRTIITTIAYKVMKISKKK